jgi:hypothetical protein
MRSSRRNWIAACVVTLVALWLVWHYRPQNVGVATPTSSSQVTSRRASASSLSITPDPSASAREIIPPNQAKVLQRQEQQWSALFMTPIPIYGKVVDENGDPIAAAAVEIGVNSDPHADKTGSTYRVSTDARGLFSLTGAHGIGFSVSASKDGYYKTNQSTGIRSVVIPSKDDLPQSSKERPIVLILHKRGQAVPLIATSTAQINVPTNGQPVSIDLASGRVGNGDLQVASWVGDSNQRRFDWRYQLSVPGGGLTERSGQFDFEAPADGYQVTTDVNMLATAQHWSFDGEREYFAKLSDGRYARFSIKFYPRRQRNFVVITSYLNPTPGDRNLEFDPAKQIKVK